MNRSQWTYSLLLLMLAPCVYADDVSIFATQANIRFVENQGSGDNQLATFSGPGVNLRASGDVSCFSPNWCGLQNLSLTPGSSLTPSVQTGGLDWVVAQGTLTFAGQPQNCGPDDCALFATGITSLSSFTFPTNGRNFTITVPAILNGAIGGTIGYADTYHQFALQVPQGRLTLSFDFVPANGGAPAYYQFEQGSFTTTPEPGTISLMVWGLAGVVGAVLRKRNCGFCPTKMGKTIW